MDCQDVNQKFVFSNSFDNDNMEAGRGGAEVASDTPAAAAAPARCFTQIFLHNAISVHYILTF